MYYYGKPHVLEFGETEGNSLQIGHVMLTQVGSQLACVCGSKPVPGFLEFVLERWVRSEYSISSPRLTALGDRKFGSAVNSTVT